MRHRGRWRHGSASVHGGGGGRDSILKQEAREPGGAGVMLLRTLLGELMASGELSYSYLRVGP